MVERDLAEMTSCPAFHCYIALRELLRDSAVRRAIRSVPSSGPFDIESLYDFFKGDTPRIRRFVEEVVINDMKRHNTPYIFVTTDVEPYGVVLSDLLDCKYGQKREDAVLRISALDDSTDSCVAVIDLLKDFGLETWKQVYELEIKDEVKSAIEFVGKIMGGRKPKREAMSHLEYYEFRRVSPYAYVFTNIEKAIESGDLEPVVKELTRVGVAFLSHIFPFISASEAMARHPLLVYGSLLFKTVNALYETAGRSDLVLKPTGNFEEDVRRMWEMLPPEYRKELEVEGEEQLLVLIERESYELFMKVQRTPLEWYSVRFVKLLLEEIGP
jgi:hypothetical protein